MTAEEPRRVAVVEDEPDLRSSVAEYLGLQGMVALEAGDGAALDALLAAGPVDLVLLDLRLPGEDGMSILRRLRASGGPPVIMVTAMGDPVDRIVGLELGADDYVVKPFEFRELLARIRSVLRRRAAPAEPTAAAAAGQVRVGRATFDMAARRLIEDDGAETALTAMEFELLSAFVERPNQVLSREQLLELAHDEPLEPFDRSIDIRVARLRRKVERDPANPTAIRTVRGAGYMFAP